MEAGGRASGNATTGSERWWALVAAWFLGEWSSCQGACSGFKRRANTARMTEADVKRPRISNHRSRRREAANGRPRPTHSSHAIAVRPPASVSPHRADGRPTRRVSQRKRHLKKASTREPVSSFVATWPAKSPTAAAWRLRIADAKKGEPCTAHRQPEMSARPQAGLAFNPRKSEGVGGGGGGGGGGGANGPLGDVEGGSRACPYFRVRGD